jgi:hypothetical protein
VTSEERRAGRGTHAGRLISILLFIFVLDAADWWSPHLGYSGPLVEFTVPLLGIMWNLLVLLLPWAALSVAVKTKYRGVLVAALIPILLVTVPFGLAEIFFFPKVSQRITTIPMSDYRVVLYRVDCGAPCSFEIAVDQERTLVPPLMLTKNLYVFDPAYEARYEVVGENELRVTTLPYDDKHPAETKLFRIESFF